MHKPVSRLLFALILCSPLALAESVWVDVRTPEEYAGDHIEGHANIPLARIEEEGTLAMFDHDDEINLYCRSGRRAEQAMSILEAAGYTNVINRGGIEEVRALPAEAVAQ